MLPHFGVDVKWKQSTAQTIISVNGDAKLTANSLIVPADISSAAFFMIAAACLPGSKLTLQNLGLNPSRIAIIVILQTYGIDISVQNERLLGREPVGDVTVKGSAGPITTPINLVAGGFTAALIDEIPIIAVLGTQVEGGLEIRDAQELRIKESDRIKSVVENLKLMGAEVEEFDDGLRVGRSNLRGAKVNSFGDHRIAMAFAVAGIFAEGETEITGAGCVDISFPGFFSILEQIAK
jgi:3-phosphoshikimate 1-carboxyvinyltransferase